jgi:ABC-2 type transport system permease protein
MNNFFRHVKVIARRDFLAVVGTPTFVLFLMGPLLMIGLSYLSGAGAESAAQSSRDAARIAILAKPSDIPALKNAEKELDAMQVRMPKLEIIASTSDDAKAANALMENKTADYFAVMYGPLATPTIQHEAESTRLAGVLGEMAERVLRARKADLAASSQMSKANMVSIKPQRNGVGGQLATAFGAVLGIFFLTIILASQAVGMLAEEKSNKVIEVIAAASPLEAVFVGKLIGMFGAALLFVSFWGVIMGVWMSAYPMGQALAASIAPAVGLVPFLALCALYFAMSYMLLGALLLAVGSLASTMREIQMLSLPVTLLQFAMYTMASQASGAPGSTMATISEIIPFSSPMAMAARAANDAALWPHAVALAWQLLWVAIIIAMGAKLFRIGVLKSGSWRTLFSRRAT